MPRSSQQRAVDRYRRRLTERGMPRFEVPGRDSDREPVRSIARRLAEVGPEERRLRIAVRDGMAGNSEFLISGMDF